MSARAEIFLLHLENMWNARCKKCSLWVDLGWGKPSKDPSCLSDDQGERTSWHYRIWNSPLSIACKRAHPDDCVVPFGCQGTWSVHRLSSEGNLLTHTRYPLIYSFSPSVLCSGKAHSGDRYSLFLSPFSCPILHDALFLQLQKWGVLLGKYTVYWAEFQKKTGEECREFLIATKWMVSSRGQTVPLCGDALGKHNGQVFFEKE